MKSKEKRPPSVIFFKKSPTCSKVALGPEKISGGATHQFAKSERKAYLPIPDPILRGKDRLWRTKGYKRK